MEISNFKLSTNILWFYEKHKIIGLISWKNLKFFLI